MPSTLRGRRVRRYMRLTHPRVGDHAGGWALECAMWPMYHQGCISMTSRYGDSMLDLSVDEQQALQIVVLRTNVKNEVYGAAYQLNWKMWV